MMASSSSSPASPSRALHSGVSVLERLGGDDVAAAENNSVANAAEEATMNNDNTIMSSSSESTNHDDEEEHEDDDDASSNNNKNLLGGSISTPAYALLVGLALENESKILSIPLTSLPTTLGKEHDGKDNAKGFVGLTEYNSNVDGGEGGPSSSTGPKLSKSMCCIYYREGTEGGKLGCYKKKKKRASSAADDHHGGAGADHNHDNNAAAAFSDEMIIEGDVDALDGMTYVPYEKPPQDDNNDNKTTEVAVADNIIRLPSMQPTDPLPPNGFFAVECTGRKIIVGGTVLKKGQHAMLRDGITVQIASHCFYFLLPKNKNDDDDTTNVRRKSIKVSLIKKSIVVDDGGGGGTESTKKKKMKRDDDNDNSDATSSSSDDDDSSTLIKSPRPTKKSKSSSSSSSTNKNTADNNNDKDSSFTSTLESKTDTELLQMLSEATQSDGWDKHDQYIGTTLATRACRAAATTSSKLQKLNSDFSGVTQRDVMNWITNESDTFGDYEKMMLRKIEPKSFIIAMGKAIIRAGYTKSDVKSGRANRWELPSDIIVPAVAKRVEPVTMKKSPSATQMKLLLPTSGGSSGGGGGANKKLPPKPIMTLPKASNKVKEEMEKEEVGEKGGETVSTVDNAITLEVNNNSDNNNDGGGGGDKSGVGAGDTTTAKEESSKSASANSSAVVPSPDELKVFVEAWLARPENARVSETLLPSAKQKDEIVKGCGVDKKRLEGYFFRLRKKLKQKQQEEAEGGATAGTKPEATKTAVVSASSVVAAAPTPTTTAGTVATTTMTQQERENIAASRAFNEAIQIGSPFKVASEEASAAAAAASAAHANQNLPQPISAGVQQVDGTTTSSLADNLKADQSDMI